MHADKRRLGMSLCGHRFCVRIAGSIPVIEQAAHRRAPRWVAANILRLRLAILWYLGRDAVHVDAVESVGDALQCVSRDPAGSTPARVHFPPAAYAVTKSPCCGGVLFWWDFPTHTGSIAATQNYLQNKHKKKHCVIQMLSNMM
jgi:hypothetical protein